MFTLIVKIARIGDRLEQYLQSRNTSDSFDHVVKIADRLGWGVHTGRINPRRRKIVKIPNSYDSYDKWEPGFMTFCIDLVPGDAKKYYCLTECEMHNRGGIFKMKRFLDY